MPRKAALSAWFAACLLAGPTGTLAQDLPPSWKPAMLTLHADSVTVTSTADGQTITLEDVHPLVSFAATLDTARSFDVFTVDSFDEHYNTCNDVKDSLGLWHQDGANALLIYAAGPDNGKAASYRQQAPIAMNPEAHNRTRTTEGGQGAMPLFIDNAEYVPTDRTMTFVVLEHTPLADGTYVNATLQAECYVK
jgi:hypothetical protein